jgi:hypothetical protein
MMKLPNLESSYKSCLFPVIVLVLVLQGCATTKPQLADPQAYKNRTKISVSGDVAVTVAVPTIAEAQAIYGAKLASKHIQPLWVEVKNDSAEPYWLLPSGLDPEYFNPSEAAFAFHTGSDEADRKIDVQFQRLSFKNPIRSGSIKAGFVLVNLDEGFKAVDIDLISDGEAKSFSFVITDPEFRGDYNEVDSKSLYADGDIIDIEDEEELHRALEELPCCATNEDGDQYGDPLNLVLVGNGSDILSALIRRDWHATEMVWSKALMRTIKSFLYGERYRYSPISPLYVYGRHQDIGFQKARGTIHERNHMRLWQSPIRFRGKKVFVGQISRDIGIKFTLKSPTISTHVIDPDVDEARRYLAEDLAYSQAVAGIGYVKGVGGVTRQAPRMNLVGDPFYTDGLRVVLFFESRPHALSDIELIEWESPSEYYAKMNPSATLKKTVAIKEAPVQDRALTKESNGIRVSTAVVGDKEANQIFGIDLARENIQAVWLEIENNGDHPVILLPTAIDPEYFSPLEVAFAYHKSFSGDANAALDDHILTLNFPIRNRIDPGTQASGYIFTNWSKQTKGIDVDLMGRNYSQNFTFFVPNPETARGQDFVDRIETMFSASELQNLESEAALRQTLEQLPCCVSDENGRPTGEPLNVVVIGMLDDWTTAFGRRGYRQYLLNPRYALGRPQDASARKQRQGYIKSQAHTIRLWQTPLRYQNRPVWVGQTSTRLGGRFADNAPPEETLPLDPSVDEARIDLVQDLAYSQALDKVGHVKGAGRVQSTQTDASSMDIHYTTDGLRVVLVFGDRPASLAGIGFFNWERLAD